MNYRQLKIHVLWVFLGVSVWNCSKEETQPPKKWLVKEVGLQITKSPGWQQDKTVVVQDPAKGGLLFRLLRENAVAGAPRIEVLAEPLGIHVTILEDFLQRNLRQMGSLESQAKIRIVDVDQRPVTLGPRPAFRVRHEYTMGEGTDQIVITQVSVFVVLNGRGVTITAAGRTELFHPLSESVEQILNSLSTPVLDREKSSPKNKPNTLTKNDDSVKRYVPPIEPVDLGKLGKPNK